MCVKIYVKCALCKHIARLISDSGLVVGIGKECPKQLISAEQDGEARRVLNWAAVHFPENTQQLSRVGQLWDQLLPQLQWI